jgi:hypothetical protein
MNINELSNIRGMLGRKVLSHQLEVFQASPARPSDKNNVKINLGIKH